MSTSHPVHGDEPIPGLPFPPLYNIVYCSRATAGVDDAAVARIVAMAQRANPVYGITGLLVYGSGIFFQWLEGPRDNVRQLMALLRNDARHQDIICLSETEEVRERLFPDWGMELVGAEDVREVLLDALGGARDPQHQLALSGLLAQLDSGALSALDQR